MSTPLLDVKGLHAAYNNAVSALHGVDFEVMRGEIVALLGANGAGKTTTLRALSNLLSAQRGRVTAGKILYDGKPTEDLPAGTLVERGLVPVLEGRHVFPSLTVEENLVTGALWRRPSRHALKRDLERIYDWFPRLRDRRTRAAGLTSGGEQQMIAIGRALLAEPKLLLLDEPSMGLAPLLVEEIFQSLVRLNGELGLSLLVAEQNSAVALRHAHRASVLENGRVELSGTAADLRRRDDIKAFYLGQGSHVGARA